VNCPKCGGESRVITSRPVIGLESGRVRWRLCHRCEHRWYSWQAPEVALPASAVIWTAESEVMVNGRKLRRAREARQ
jgi:transcriptional regulator NrdR family protein